MALTAVLACGPASTLPVIIPAPRFSLVDQRGQSFSSSSLDGKVVVADFVYTTCPDICPLLTANMALIRDGLERLRLLPAKAMLVSITVDPETDTSAALATYAERFRADPASWVFLTGDRPQIEALLTTGYKLGAPQLPTTRADSKREIAHTTRFVVIDRDGQIRWYPRGDEVEPGLVVEEVRKLAG